MRVFERNSWIRRVVLVCGLTMSLLMTSAPGNAQSTVISDIDSVLSSLSSAQSVGKISKVAAEDIIALVQSAKNALSAGNSLDSSLSLESADLLIDLATGEIDATFATDLKQDISEVRSKL